MGILLMFANVANLRHPATMKTLSLIIATSLLVVLGGCNTVKGIGQDLQKAGETLESAAKKK
jgi:predicted small secreted protein